MLIRGDELFAALISGQVPELKLVFNAAGALFCPVDQQHRDQKAPGISYEDEYAGNALAAMLRPGRIDIRHHRAFSDAQVLGIVKALSAAPQLAPLGFCEIRYQGRVLS